VAATPGKRAIRNKLPKEITDLIGALKAIMQMESKSAKKAGTSRPLMISGAGVVAPQVRGTS
jgi:hypothetical protein